MALVPVHGEALGAQRRRRAEGVEGSDEGARALHQEGMTMEVFDFSRALALLKSGERVTRAGWNGSRMWIVLLSPQCTVYRSKEGTHDVFPCIAMRTASGALQPGWLASHADLLAEDWRLL